MKATQNTIDFLIESEASKNLAYKDSAGLWTIGVGHLINLKTEKHLLTAILSNSEISELLMSDLKPCIDCINSTIKVPLNQNKVDAIASFIFNVGRGAWKSSTLLKRINADNSPNLIEDAFMMWNKITKDGALVESKGLMNRRKKEIAMYFKQENQNV